MTDHPRHHPERDIDSLNSMLDALVSGKRAPESGSASDIDTFAAVHRLVSGDAAADLSATLPDTLLEEIWRNVMHTAPTVSFAGDGFAPPRSAREEARLHAVPERPRLSRFQSLLSVAAVAALLLALVAAAWIGRGGDRPPDPGTTRYAVSPLDSGTPDATPRAAATPEATAWLEPVSWEKCEAEPMTSGDYVDIIQEDADLSGRSYEMVGPPAPDAMDAAVSSLRNYQACNSAPFGEFDENRLRSLTTETHLRETSSPLSMQESIERRDSDPAYAQLEAHFRSLPESSFVVVLGSEAPQDVQDIWAERQVLSATPDSTYGPGGEDTIYVHETPYGVLAFNPDLVVELGDGRVAIPATVVYWTEDPNLEILGDLQRDSFGIVVTIMAEENGVWLLDEQIRICVAGCEPPSAPVASPIATPAGFAPDVQLASHFPVSLRAEPSTQSDIVL